MPANLTPDYLKAEQEYRTARTHQEKIAALEQMLATVPKHKGTDKLQADIKHRLSQERKDSQKKGATHSVPFYLVEREGAGQVVLLGPPNSGKSQLVCSLTHACPEVADYPFTTRLPTPGMMLFENVQIQLVDLPPLMDETAEAWLPRVLRKSDALAFVIDAGEDPAAQMEILVEGLREMSLPPVAGEGRPGAEGAPATRGFICLSKVDLAPDARAAVVALARWPLHVAAVAALDGRGLDEFRAAAFRSLDKVRVYTKVPHRKADHANPMVMPSGSTIEQAALSVHKEFARGLRYARVWGAGLFEGQMVGRDHVLRDGDIVEFHR